MVIRFSKKFYSQMPQGVTAMRFGSDIAKAARPSGTGLNSLN